MYFLKRFSVIVLIQLLILSFIFILFLFNFNQRREINKIQSKELASIIGEQASNYFQKNRNHYSSNDFFNYLDSQIGVQKLTNAFNVNPPEILTIYFVSDIEKGVVNAGVDANFAKDDTAAINKQIKYFFNNKYVAIKPFFLNGYDKPYGIVRIETSTIPILTDVLAHSGIFYLFLYLILNNQAFLFYLWVRKKQDVVLEQGYLKESSLGAIKIMHKLLGDVIDDHKEVDGSKSASNDKTNIINLDDKK